MPESRTARARVYLLIVNLLNKIGSSYHPDQTDYIYRNHLEEQGLLKQTLVDMVDLHEFLRKIYDAMPIEDAPIGAYEQQLAKQIEPLTNSIWLVHQFFNLDLDQLYTKSYDYRYSNEFMFSSMPEKPHHYMDGLAVRSRRSARATQLIEAVVAKMRASVTQASATASSAIQLVIKGELSDQRLNDSLAQITKVQNQFEQIQKLLLKASERAKDVSDLIRGNTDQAQRSIAQLGDELFLALKSDVLKSNPALAELEIFKSILTTGAIISALQSPETAVASSVPKIARGLRARITSHFTSPPSKSDLPLVAQRPSALPATIPSSPDLELKLWQIYFDHAKIDLTAAGGCGLLLRNRSSESLSEAETSAK